MSVVELGTQFEDSDGEIKFPVAEPGTYEARITGAEDCVSGENSKHPGTPMWKVSFLIVEEGEAKGISLSKWMTLPSGEGTEWMEDKERNNRIDEIKRLWIATGAPSDGGNIESEDLVHLSCSIVVRKGSYKGKPSNDISDILPL